MVKTSNTWHYHWYWPFGENNEKETFHESRISNSEGLPGQLSSGTLVGALEVLTGSAIGFCFGGTVVGGIIAGGLVADGLTRIANDGQRDLERAFKDRQFRSPFQE